MKPYERKANYYGTDQMGIIHHSNYIRWFEEARIDYMEQMGAGFKELEDAGITVPVLSVSCRYISMVRFGDTVLIHTSIDKYTGTRISISYRIVDKATGQLRTEGNSEHCFLNKSGRPVSLKRDNPLYDEAFRNNLKV